MALKLSKNRPLFFEIIFPNEGWSSKHRTILFARPITRKPFYFSSFCPIVSELRRPPSQQISLSKKKTGLGIFYQIRPGWELCYSAAERHKRSHRREKVEQPEQPQEKKTRELLTRSNHAQNTLQQPIPPPLPPPLLSLPSPPIHTPPPLTPFDCYTSRQRLSPPAYYRFRILPLPRTCLESASYFWIRSLLCHCVGARG